MNRKTSKISIPNLY